MLSAVYTAERFVLQKNFSGPQNPRFIIESGFKSRAVFNGACTVYQIEVLQFAMPIEALGKKITVKHCLENESFNKNRNDNANKVCSFAEFALVQNKKITKFKVNVLRN